MLRDSRIAAALLPHLSGTISEARLDDARAEVDGRGHSSAAITWPRRASSFGPSRRATTSIGSVVDRLRFST